jgi:DNA polymerase-3 subunit gamma/tau
LSIVNLQLAKDDSTMAKRKTNPGKTSTESSLVQPAEEYTVLARRYRPQQFADLVGQEVVAQALVNAVQSNRVAHAYLFTGARGVGKTSAARILAKALNCEKGPTPTPCDVCEICQSIASGEDIDVLEIDGASNRNIDDIREIRSNVQYRPSRARYKIYIIDEVHALDYRAYPALLKTLEEPPPHVKFIFATTDPNKIPLPILSRCQRFDFAGISTPKIVERLCRLIAAEGRQADDEALTMIARRAAGSMRDAQSLLDQLLAFGGDRVTPEQVHALLGTANEDRVAEIAAAVLEPDPKRALELIGKAADSGLQLGEVLDQLIEYWRDLMVAHCTGLESQVLSQSGPRRETLLKQAQTLELDTILAGLDVLASTKSRMRNTSHGRVVLEMALVRLCRLEHLVSLSQLAKALNQDGSSAPKTRSAAPARPSDTEKKKELNEVANENSPQTPLVAETVNLIWSQVLSQVGPMLANELKKAKDVAIFGPNSLVIRFPAGYNLDENQYLDQTRVARIERLLHKITGQACSLRIENSSGPISAETSSGAIAEEPETSQSRSRRSRAEAMQQPLVTRAMEVLGAQIVQMDDGFGSASGVVTEERPDTTETEED